MTTVAWDGETLAVDSRLTGMGRCSVTRKLFKSQQWVFAGAGRWSDVLTISRWIADGMPRDAVPSLDSSGPFGIVANRKTGRVYELDGSTLALMPCRKMAAIGAGAHYALAAMALGKSAPDAVRLAMRFDVFTGGPVRTWKRGE